jgi:gas vesicle protein
MRNSNEIFFFFLGIATGVVVAFLTAPYSGQETRQYLRERVDEGRQGAEEALERGKEFVERQTHTVSDALGSARKTVSEGI